MGPHGKARATIGEECRVGVVAPALREHVPAAEGDPALAVGEAVFCSAVAVGSPPPVRLIRSPPICVGADVTVMLFTTYLGVVVRLDVFDGLQGATIG